MADLQLRIVESYEYRGPAIDLSTDDAWGFALDSAPSGLGSC